MAPRLPWMNSARRIGSTCGPRGGTMRGKFLMAVLAAAVAVLATAPGAVAMSSSDEGCPLPVFGPGSTYHPDIDPDAFTAHVDNPLFPLVVGRTLVYSGTKDGMKAIDL